MALAKIKIPLAGLQSQSGLTAKLFVLDGAQNASPVATISTINYDTQDLSTYWCTVDATSLLGIYLIKVYYSNGDDAGSGFVYITNTTDVHVVQGSPAAIVAAGSTVNASFSTGTAGITSSTVGTELTIQRGDTVIISFSGLGSLASRTGEKIWFTCKKRLNHTDSEATIQISETSGLIRLNGAAATSGNASLSVTNAVTGALTITLKPAMTSLLGAGELDYDLQILETAVVRTLTQGKVTVTADVTRAVS